MSLKQDLLLPLTMLVIAALVYIAFIGDLAAGPYPFSP